MAFNPNGGMPKTNMYGVQQPGMGATSDRDWEIAAGLAGMPDSGLTNNLFNAQQPGGEMIGRVYVGQSPLQGLNAAMRQGMGGMMVKNRADQAKGLISALRKNQPSQAGQQGYGAQTPNYNGEGYDGYNGVDYS